MKRVIAFDIDSCLGDLITPWCERIYSRTGYHIDPAGVRVWNFVHEMPKEYQETAIDILDEPDLYNDVLPIKDSLNAVNAVRDNGDEAIFVTSVTPGSAGRKIAWLKKWGFLPKIGHVSGYYEVYDASDKNKIKADVLIDDRYETVRDYPGMGVVFRQSYNENFLPDLGQPSGVNKDGIQYVNSWHDFIGRYRNNDFGPHPTELRRPLQSQRFREIVDKMYQTHLEKNTDYSPANLLATGTIGISTRIWDKTARLANLLGVNIEIGEVWRDNEGSPSEIVLQLLQNTFALMTLAGFRYEIKSMTLRPPQKPKFESITDTYLDGAVYNIIGLLEQEGVWGK